MARYKFKHGDAITCPTGASYDGFIDRVVDNRVELLAWKYHAWAEWRDGLGGQSLEDLEPYAGDVEQLWAEYITWKLVNG